MGKRRVIPAVLGVILLMIMIKRCALINTHEKMFQEYKDNLADQMGQHQTVDDNYNNDYNNNFVTPEQNQEVSYFENAKKYIANYASTDNIEKIKQTGKDCIVTAVDFVFYDKPINGVYFSSLTNDAKRAILIQISNIDAAIMEYYPDYKTELSQKYNDASGYLNARYLGTLDTIKQRLTSVTYDEIEDTTSQITDKIGEGYKKGQSFIKDKYNEWSK